MIKRLFLLTALVLVSTVGQAQTPPGVPAADVVRGWRAAIWGMSPDQVVSAFEGEVKRLAEPDTYGPDSKYLAPIGIDDFDLAGVRVKVRFLFPRDSLRLTEVHFQRLEDRPSFSSRADFTRLAQLLSEKYGAATFQNSEGNKAAMSWSLPATVIELSYSYLPGLMQLASLNYIDKKTRNIF